MSFFNYVLASRFSPWETPMITELDSWISWLFALPSERRWPGSNHWLDWSLEPSALPTVWWAPNNGDAAYFASKASLSGNRQIGQVACFCSHTSMQARWKLWRHDGIIRSTSFSSYSPKHIEHLLQQNDSNFVKYLRWQCTGILFLISSGH